MKLKNVLAQEQGVNDMVTVISANSIILTPKDRLIVSR
jgi:hypothetical protein